MKVQSWLWRDRNFGKRESRLLREEHNRTVQQHADLLSALEPITRCVSINGPAGTTAYIIADANMARARAAIAKARGDA